MRKERGGAYPGRVFHREIRVGDRVRVGKGVGEGERGGLEGR